jgi:restriction system protein
MKDCFKEWNAVVEALGQGKQSVLVRKFTTYKKDFLLYPTVSYVNKKHFMDDFQDNKKKFVKNNLLPKTDGKKVEVKYFAKVEKIKEFSPNALSKFNKNFIWNMNHVRSYLGNRKGFVWLLRVYELEEPVMGFAMTRAITFAKLANDVDVKAKKPVISDAEFNKILEKF